MAEEETFECVFGYGDCPIRALMIAERQKSIMMMKAIPLDVGKDMPKEMREGLNVFLRGLAATMSRMMQAASDLGVLGPFCAACPKAWEQIGKVLSDISAETQPVKPAEEE